MEPLADSAQVFHFRNRTLILVVSPPIILFCTLRILAGWRSGDPWLNWLFGLILWLYLLLLALRRRLVLTRQGLEYTDGITTVRVPWSYVNKIVSRKTLGIWSVDCLLVRTQGAQPRDLFIDLNQFSRLWRQEELGAALRHRAPHLFDERPPTHSAA